MHLSHLPRSLFASQVVSDMLVILPTKEYKNWAGQAQVSPYPGSNDARRPAATDLQAQPAQPDPCPECLYEVSSPSSRTWIR
jgi:hypothetical protein